MGFACWTDACRAIRNEVAHEWDVERWFDSEMDELSKSPRLTKVVLVSLFHMFYEFEGCRAISLDFARHDQTNFSSVSLNKPTPSRQIYKKLASGLLLQRFLLIQLFWLFVSSSAGWLMSFNCFYFSPESQRWITKVRGKISLNLKHL